MDISDNEITINKGAKSEVAEAGKAGIRIERGSDVSDCLINCNLMTGRINFELATGEGVEIGCKEISTSSDIKLKKNIESVENAEEIIDNFNPVYWNWKSNNKKSCGLIAQDVQKITPDAVSNSIQGGLSLNYNYFIGLLIARVKELSDEIKELKKD